MRFRTQFWPALALAAGGWLATASPAAAQLAVEPLFLEVHPGQSAAIRARNTSDKQMTLELLITRRHVDREGNQTRTDADNDFILIPPQAVVPPLGAQVFRLQPLPNDATTSESYFVTVKQLPVKMDDIPGGGAQLQIVFAFDVAVHVVPDGADAKPELVSAAPSTMMVDAEKPSAAPADAASPAAAPSSAATQAAEAPKQIEVPAVDIVLRNAGTKYLYLQNLDFVAKGIDATGKRVNLPDWDQTAITNAAGVTLLEPGAEREFKLPLRNAPALRSVEVEIRQRPQV